MRPPPLLAWLPTTLPRPLPLPSWLPLGPGRAITGERVPVGDGSWFCPGNAVECGGALPADAKEPDPAPTVRAPGVCGADGGGAGPARPRCCTLAFPDCSVPACPPTDGTPPDCPAYDGCTTAGRPLSPLDGNEACAAERRPSADAGGGPDGRAELIDRPGGGTGLGLGFHGLIVVSAPRALLFGKFERACQADPARFFVILAKARIHFDVAVFSATRRRSKWIPA